MTVPDLTPDAIHDMVRPEESLWPRIIKWGVTVGIIVPLIWSVVGLEISIGRMLATPGQVWSLLTGMFPPDFDDWPRLMSKLLESLYVAWIGTLIGAAFSFPAGFMAATNIAPRWVAIPTRGILSGIRAFPELVLAIIFIVPFGLGPFTGALAIGLHSIGTLGKLSSEVIEGVDEGPVEAIGASGGNLFMKMRFGIVPQAMPNIVAYWLYRFEINVRASAVLGIVGAGGIGAEIVGRLRFRGDWPKAGAALLLTIGAVLVIDAISASVRRRIITGQPSRTVISKWMTAITGSHRDPRFEIENA
ncbi:MAG: phosphonate ABC transporter, permease protein PhnE [Actinomycetota bacterium]|nr:phosphonate ABC transporter, permease protein PhnE [Actinomycetota bacterium]